MELVHFHIFQRNTPAVGDGHTVAHTGKGVAGDPPGPAIATRGKEHRLGMEGGNLSRTYLHGNYTAGLLITEQQVKHKVFVEEAHLVLDGVLVHGLENHVTGTVGGIARATNRGLAKIASVPTDASLVD